MNYTHFKSLLLFFKPVLISLLPYGRWYTLFPHPLFLPPLSFVDAAVRSVDNTLTIIIASAVGGAIALLMGFMLLKNFTLFVLSKLKEKK